MPYVIVCTAPAYFMSGTTTPGKIKPLYAGTQIVWYLFSVVEAILLFRFLLKIIQANPQTGFTDFIYSISQPLVKPFLGVLESSSVAGGLVEWSSLLALLVYWMVAWGIVRLIVMLRPVSKEEASEQLHRQEPD